MTSQKALETSIFWQQMVLKESRNPAQKERATLAIEKLEKQLKQLLEQKA